jgi:cell division protein FtsA
VSDQIITGIDIGTSKIATIVAKISENEKEPRIMGFVNIPSQGVKKGQIVDINQVTDVIEESVEKVERMSGTRVEKAFVSVAGPQISSLNSHGVVAVSQPEVEITESDVSRAVDAAKAISISSTSEVIEVIPREYVVDGQSGIKNPLGMTGVRLEVNTHIITANLTNLKNIERCLADLGIEKKAFVFSGLTSSLAGLTETEKELGVVLVDIGGGKTDVCIYVEGALSYSSSIPIGARHITNDIAVGLRVSLESAEKIKLFLTEREKEKKEGKKDEVNVKDLKLAEGLTTFSYKTLVNGIIRPRLEEIFEKVFEEIQKSGFLATVPSGIVITGGGALTVGAVEAARRVTELPARIATPSGMVGLIDEVLYPQYATVVGLIMYGKEFMKENEKISFKDFGRIFREFSFGGSFKKVVDLFKSFLP